MMSGLVVGGYLAQSKPSQRGEIAPSFVKKKRMREGVLNSCPYVQAAMSLSDYCRHDSMHSGNRLLFPRELWRMPNPVAASLPTRLNCGSCESWACHTPFRRDGALDDEETDGAASQSSFSSPRRSSSQPSRVPIRAKAFWGCWAACWGDTFVDVSAYRPPRAIRLDKTDALSGPVQYTRPSGAWRIAGVRLKPKRCSLAGATPRDQPPAAQPGRSGRVAGLRAAAATIDGKAESTWGTLGAGRARGGGRSHRRSTRAAAAFEQGAADLAALGQASRWYLAVPCTTVP